MSYRKISEAEKNAVMAAIRPYLAKGWTLNSAYKQVAAEYQQEGKSIPSQDSVAKWLEGANPDGQDGLVIPGRTDGPGMPEPEGPDGQPGKSPETGDYTRRLELICRLYRTRSENAVDAVCDELLPELFTEEN